MVEGEGGEPQIPEEVLTAGYWDGHGPDDDCDPDENVKIDLPRSGRHDFAPPRTSKFANQILQEFLAVDDRSVHVRVASGEMFEAENYPPGTVIGFDRESLSSAGYRTGRRLGVVCVGKNSRERLVLSEYEAKTTKRMLIGQTPMPPGYKDPSYRFPVGGVIHIPPNYMSRVTNLDVYQMGKGVPEKPKKLRLPHGFRRSQPGGAGA